MSNFILECKNLTKTYTDAGLHVEVLKGVNFQIHPGEMVAIMGASGSGKSTFLQILGGLDKPNNGEVLINGVEISHISQSKIGSIRNRILGFVFQFHHLLPEFNALENVAMPLLIRGTKPKIAAEKARELLVKVGLEKRFYHRVAELSGGERQRVAIARALVTDSKCVLADEPTGNLDNRTSEHVLDLLLHLNQDLKTSFIIVTHDSRIAKRMNRTLILEDGQLQAHAV